MNTIWLCEYIVFIHLYDTVFYFKKRSYLILTLTSLTTKDNLKKKIEKYVLLKFGRVQYVHAKIQH